ncbi:MAG: cysteine--tRNA ligase [Gammaproteobacteria bacterium]|nr:cysteine--tRNA ligase [Gammaproteobacteria bacterium]
MISLYNTLTNKKEAFVPIKAGEVGLYVCGMTVYDYCHLGHARVMVAFDVMVRHFRHRGFKVNYVRNITDIDDKIIARANENGEEFLTLTERFIQAMHDDSDALGVLPPDAEPRATQSMPSILKMIAELIEKEFAYQAENGDVYYSVKSFAEYGKLSGRQVEDLRAGARVEIGEQKRDPLDFVLWKMAKADEPFWDSPWGKGRPGWHIECSAMSTDLLGTHFDIHGGGQDLQFPHHENEIAQSEGCHGHKTVNYWLHNGFVRINDEKMSKSLGNFFTVRDILERYRAEEVRYFILTSQYRSPLNYDEEHLLNARAALTRFYTTLRDLPVAEAVQSSEYEGRFNAAMDDDFNTPEALAVLFEMAREVNRLKEKSLAEAAPLAASLKTLAGVLGILQNNPDEFFKQAAGSDEGLSDGEVDQLIEARYQARADKNWAEADRIRDQLKEAHIVLEDAAGKTHWRRA